MRTRDLKPKFFRNTELAKLPFATRLLYAGLWGVADKRGRLVDEPKLIKADVFPLDNVKVDAMLRQLEQAGFIERYEALGIHCIWIPKFRQHQHPHPNEPESMLPPAMSELCRGNDMAITKEEVLHGDAIAPTFN